MNYSKQKNNQDGVALLFALGLLSLLLVIGLGFFTSTSISAKIANNNRNRSQAKTLSQAAISRVLIALMQYQHDTFNSTPSYLPRDFSEVYSHEVGTTEIENVPDNYKYVSAIRSNNLDLSISDNKDAKIVREPINDFLKGDKSLLQFTNDTLSFIPKSKLDEYKNKLKDSDDTTSWVYLTTQKYDNEENFVFDEIIGRFAYKVIPSVPSRINIHTFLAGTTKYFPEYKDDNSKIQSFPWFKGEESSNTPTPNNFRLGREIDELDIQNSIFAFNYVNRKDDVPQELSKLVETEGISDASLKKWFEFWLVDSKIKIYKQNGVEIITPPTPIANELFLGYKDNKEIALKRFNISYISGVDPETECNWYARFKLTEEQKNSDDIVEMIASDCKPFSDKDDMDPIGDIAKKEEYSGLQYFKRIGNTAGSFATLTDRRKQIVANFNDYCDKDSIPTSDVPAKNWSIDASAQSPKYTGNENTPYINEFALGFEVNKCTLTPDVTNKNATTAIELNPSFIYELVNIYPNLDNVTQYNFETQISNIEVTISVTANVTITKKDLTTEPAILTGSGVLKLPDENKTIKIEDSLTNISSNNYYAKEYKISNKLQNTITLELPSDKKTIEIQDIKIDDIEYKLEEIKYKQSNMLLSETKNSNKYGIDYVNINKDIAFENTNSISQGIFNKITNPPTEPSNIIDLNNNNKFFYLTGFEVIDPRQNLNFSQIALTEDNAATATDWKVSLTINYPTEDADTLIGSLKRKKDLTWEGHVNTCTPADPFNGFTTKPESTNYDIEQATDIAWKNNTVGNHISTAYIKNAPMLSPWELGLIHRGAAWQTINLKSALDPEEDTKAITPKFHKLSKQWNDPDGTSYQNGDGGILDQIKMTDASRAQGKVNIDLLHAKDLDFSENATYNKKLLIALFSKICYGKPISESINHICNNSCKLTNMTDDQATKITGFDGVEATNTNRPTKLRSQLLNWDVPTISKYKDAFGIITFKKTDDENPANNINIDTDATHEEFIGKTINLIDTASSLPSTIRVVIVAQTIKDIGMPIPLDKLKPNKAWTEDNFDEELKKGFVVTKLSKKYPDRSATVSCHKGVFNYAIVKDTSQKNGQQDTKITVGTTRDDHSDDNEILYFDEITGEVKMLVTIDRDPLTGKLTVRNIEYLE